MKSIGILFGLVLLLHGASVTAQPYWLWQSPKPQGQGLFGCTYVENGFGLAVGQCGAVVRTTNGGDTWHAIDAQVPRGGILKGVGARSDGRALAVGTDIGVLISENGFLDWRVVYPDPPLTNYVDAIWIDAQTAIVAGDRGAIRTTDGGDTWSRLIEYPRNLSGIVSPAKDLLVAVLHSGPFLRSSDGGVTWKEIYRPMNSWYLYDVSFVDENIGIAVGSSAFILRTEDGGNTWSQIHSSSTNTLRGVAMYRDGTGIAVGDSAYGRSCLVMRTIDSGRTWSHLSTPTKESASDISVDDDGNYLMITGRSGSLFVSTDRGDTWQTGREGTYANFLGVELLDSLSGIVVGSAGTIYRTKDAGAHWEPQHSGVRSSLNDVHSLSADSSVVVGDDGVILRTTDAGVSWGYTQIPPGNDIKACWYHPNGVIVAVGTNGMILRSTDHGNTWASRPTGSIQPDLNDLAFSDTLNGIAVGTSGYYFLTHDGGATWTTQQYYERTSFTGVSMPTPGIMYLSGIGGGLLRSTDGGSSFDSVTISNLTLVNTSHVCFSSADTGCFVVAATSIHETVDGGLSWNEYRNCKPIYAVASLDHQNTVFVGEDGTIRRRSNTPTVTSIGHLDLDTPSSSNGLRVYPNPSSLSFTIRIDDPEWTTDQGVVVVYDTQGCEVYHREVNSEHLRTGLMVESSDLVPGIYFIQVHSRSASRSSMVVITGS